MNNKPHAPIHFQPADRIAVLKAYYHQVLDQKIAGLRAGGAKIYRLDIGSPDRPPADHILAALEKSARDPGKHGYMPHGGTPEYREAVAQYYRSRFEIDLDPKTEILGLLGSKEGLFHLSQAFLNPGDVALVPDPGYPVYRNASLIAGAEVVDVPLLEERAYLPDLASIPADVARRAKLFWLNYPHNPTGASADEAFLADLVAFARENEILIAYDAPYMEVCYDGNRALSILQVPGAQDVAVEFNSLSKTYNMAGWRMGAAVGNPQVISYLSKYKGQADSSTFAPLMDAAVAAMTGDQTWIVERNALYQERKDLIYRALTGARLHVFPPRGSLYLWARIPSAFPDSIDFCSKVLDQTNVSLTPGVIYGRQGEGHFRVSVTAPTDEIVTALERLADFLSSIR